MSQLTRVQFFKLVAKLAKNSRPFRVSAEWTYNSGHWWAFSVTDESVVKFSSLNSCRDDAVNALKRAAAKGVVAGEEIK